MSPSSGEEKWNSPAFCRNAGKGLDLTAFTLPQLTAATEARSGASEAPRSARR